ncbi:MAG: glycosyltransferase family 2 protein [Verrucomicrobiales bacterium]
MQNCFWFRPAFLYQFRSGGRESGGVWENARREARCFTRSSNVVDFWNAAFFCGSAAVLRRSCIDIVGGFEADSITEDAEIALMLHAKGFRSA